MILKTVTALKSVLDMSRSRAALCSSIRKTGLRFALRKAVEASSCSVQG